MALDCVHCNKCLLDEIKKKGIRIRQYKIIPICGIPKVEIPLFHRKYYCKGVCTMSYRNGRVNEDNVNAAVMQAKILSDFVMR